MCRCEKTNQNPDTRREYHNPLYACFTSCGSVGESSPHICCDRLPKSTQQGCFYEASITSAIQEFACFLRNSKLIAPFTTSLHLFVFWGRLNQSTLSNLISLTSALILSSHPRLRLPSAAILQFPLRKSCKCFSFPPHIHLAAWAIFYATRESLNLYTVCFRLWHSSLWDTVKIGLHSLLFHPFFKVIIYATQPDLRSRLLQMGTQRCLETSEGKCSVTQHEISDELKPNEVCSAPHESVHTQRTQCMKLINEETLES
jgi:hypothetical protein